MTDLFSSLDSSPKRAAPRRREGGRAEDQGGRLIHHCWCGKWGAFGFGVSLLKGETGQWFCGEHRFGRSGGAA